MFVWTDFTNSLICTDGLLFIFIFHCSDLKVFVKIDLQDLIKPPSTLKCDDL